jgi:two-component system, cell cycle response regulator DivK
VDEVDSVLVVYVEDNPVNLQLVTWVLEASGRYRVLGAQDGLSGLALVQQHHPDIALIDLDLPLLTGLELARRIHQDPALTHIPLVAISASVMGHEHQRSLDAGCRAFIEKPFDIHRLRQVVAELTEAALERPTV